MDALNATITNVLNIMTVIGLGVCGLFMAWAGFKFMTSGGSPSAIEAAKSGAFNAAIGFALVLSARVIANIVQSVVVLG